MKRKYLGVFCLIVLALTAAVWSATEDSKRGKRSEKAENTATKMREEIQAEIKSLPKHEWAGEYYHGNGLGVNVSLRLAPKSGFVFVWHGCMGLYDRNYGPVESKNGRIHLSCTFVNERKGFQGIAEELIPVAWGSRVYLIPSDEMVEFCNDVNDGTEPREGMHGNCLLRRGDEKKPATGFPDVPKEFKPYLLKTPIVAEIAAVGKQSRRPMVGGGDFKDTIVTVNVGKDGGILPGMELLVTKPDTFVKSVKITKVEKGTAEGVMTEIGENDPAPKVGWKLSTLAPWHVKQDDKQHNESAGK